MTAWLVTWLWQGCALAGGVAVALRCASRLNAATQHLVWWGALAVLTWLGWAGSPEPAMTTLQGAAAEPVLYVPSAPDVLISALVGIWAAIALVALLRLVPGLHAVYALRDRCRPFPAHIEAALPLWLEAKGRGRVAELLVCDSVPGATVLGLQSPCIAVSPALVEALTLDELDQVILHEHAHVQRFDDWLQLAQRLALSVLWIHPAALFVSRALNREREMACDEWVVARTRQPKAYARCLARAAEVRSRVKGGSVLVPALQGRRHELVRRVERLLTLTEARRSVSFAGAGAAACAMMVLAVQLQGVRFAEIAEIALPHVGGPMLAVYGALAVVEPKPVVDDRAVRAAQPVARAVPDAPVADAPAAAVAAIAPAPIALVSPVIPASPVLSARVFSGTYPPDRPGVNREDQPGPWRAMAAPGVEIASAAKKTGVGVANAIGRAGVSLARSF